MNIQGYQINAFAKTPEGGNPAGVVSQADGLSEAQMQKIANVLGFSETAFVMKSDIADYRVRFFTPTEEVDLCGHATIGAFSVLLQLSLIRPGVYKQETKAGVLTVEVLEDGLIWMNQTMPTFYEQLEKREIAESLNIEIGDIHETLPIQMVSTGLKDILVPIKSMAVLNAIKPDMDRVSAVSKKYNAVGYHLFALEAINDANAHCRNLAPLFGIPEESATGTSNGALACYLFTYNQVSSERALKMVFEQGYTMGLPSEIFVSLTTENTDILEVRVGGKALNLLEQVIEL